MTTAIKTTPSREVPVPERQPLDPITKHLWRFQRGERNRLLTPFIGEQVTLWRWYGRVASGGDETYKGEFVALATSTVKSAADFVILRTTDGTTWALSTAQVAEISVTEQPRKRPGRRAAS
jgi:alpha-beta hydrolase superfamily lysophospholipase